MASTISTLLLFILFAPASCRSPHRAFCGSASFDESYKIPGSGPLLLLASGTHTPDTQSQEGEGADERQRQIERMGNEPRLGARRMYSISSQAYFFPSFLSDGSCHSQLFFLNNTHANTLILLHSEYPGLPTSEYRSVWSLKLWRRTLTSQDVQMELGKAG